MIGTNIDRVIVSFIQEVFVIFAVLAFSNNNAILSYISSTE